MIKNKKYLLSGIGPGDDGVGRLMKALAPEAKLKDFKLLYKLSNKTKETNNYLLRRILHLLEQASTNLRKAKIVTMALFASNSKFLILHPQTIGFDLIFKIHRKNKIYMYVMDNSFFCIRSYNISPINNMECLRCIGDPTKAYTECEPWPVHYDRKAAFADLQKLMSISKEINFLVQNKLQEEIIKKHFGDVKTLVVGLNIVEISGDKLNALPKKDKNQKKIVYHGATHYAKGVEYFVRLAEKIPEINFIIPDEKYKVEDCLQKTINTTNIVFTPCTWENGLRELVSDACLVVNPSQWSAPIEGALLKSIIFNGSVATVKTQYGYEKEISQKYPILRLSQNVEEAKNQILQYLQNQNSRKEFPQGGVKILELISSEWMSPLDAVENN